MITYNILPSSPIANVDIPSAPHISYASEDQFFTPVYHPDKETDLDELPIYFAHGSESLFDSDTDPKYPPIYYGHDVEFIPPPTWRDDLEAFVKTLDPCNLVLPHDFDPSFCDPYGRNTISLWIRKRPGTPFLMALVDKREFNEGCTKCTDYSGFTSLICWRIYRGVENIDPKFIYASLWNVYRKGEPMPMELSS